MINTRRSVLSLLLLLPASAFAADSPGQAKINYQDHILPIFRNSCLNCHNPDKKKAGLDLSTHAAVLAGSDGNKVINPGDPDGSLLYRCVMHLEEPAMPQKAGKLPDKELNLIKQWIALGALETANGKAVAPTKPKVDLSVVATIGKPDGPPPMPAVKLPEQPLVKTRRAGPVLALAASPWAPIAAMAGQRQIALYQTDTQALVGYLPFAEGIADTLRFSRNGKVLLAAGGQGAKLGKVVLFDIATGKRITELGEEYDTILSADLSADQSLVAIGTTNRLLKIISTADGQVLHSLKKHTDWVTAVAFSPDGRFIASGDRAGNLVIWEASTAQPYYSPTGHKGAITELAFRDDGKLLASSSEDGTVKLWNLSDGAMYKSVNAHGSGVLSVAFAHDGRMATAGRDKLVKTWKVDGSADKSYPPAADIALKVAFTHDGSHLLASDFTGETRVLPAVGKENKVVGVIPTTRPVK